MEKFKIRVAISHGDINGINYELLLKCFSEPVILELFTPVVYGSLEAYRVWQKKLNIESPAWHIAEHIGAVRNGMVNLINCEESKPSINIGQPTEEAGKLAYLALEQAVRDVQQGKAQVLVTAPINKATMPQDLFPYKGHTKYLEEKTANETGKSLMLLTARDCRVALATEHIPISEVSKQLSQQIIIDKVKILETGLIRDFRIIKPRIAVLALNPHAGDSGLLGTEEESIIQPAIKALRDEGILAFGAYPADGFFSSDISASFDGVLAMYHDQGLAPFKAMYMNEGVNCTLGLSIIRTSPDHGTAYDIAGKDKADPTSLRTAIYQAIDMYRSRQAHREATRNPLRDTYFNRGRDDEKLDLEKDAYTDY